MDVSELRSAFTLATSVTERIRKFREDRIAKLHNNKTPVSLMAGNSRTILHCIPLESFSGVVQYDVLKFSQNAAKVPPILTGGGWSSRINLDGLVTYSGGADGSMAYTQLFRNGTIEAVEASWLNVNYKGKRTIPHVAVEQEILKYLPRLFGIQKELGVSPPIVVGLTLTETKGLEIAPDITSFGSGNQITEDDLIFPEIVVGNFDEPPGKILKPIFDLVWNACGHAKSRNFDDQGNWIRRQGY